MALGSWFLVEEFEWCDQDGCLVAEAAIDSTDMRGFVGIGDVAAVPRDQYVTLMDGSECQVECISGGVCWHHFVGNVGLHEIVRFFGDV